MMYIIARTAKQRPTLMHKLSPRIFHEGTAGQNMTVCGIDIRGWSRAYFTEAIPQVLCKKCGAQK